MDSNQVFWYNTSVEMKTDEADKTIKIKTLGPLNP
jgi:hypothetical protein